MRRMSSIPAPPGGVPYQAPLKRVRPGYVPTPSVCGIDPRTSGRMDCDVIDVNSAPDESAKESSYFHVHGSHL